jgi:hypothetical protein
MPGVDPAAHNSGGPLVSGDQVQVTGMIVTPSACHRGPAIKARCGDTGSPVRNSVFERLQPLEPARLRDSPALVLVIHGEPPALLMP